MVEAGQGADGKGTTIWSGSRYPAETTDSLHHYSGALCMGVDASGECASVFYVVQTLPGDQSVTQELVDKMNASGYRAEVVAAYQTVGGAPYLDYTDTVFGQVYEGMDVVDAIASVQTDRNDRPQVEQKIASITVDTHGETYPEPEKLAPAASAVTGSRHHSSSAARKPARADEIFFRMAWSLILSWVVWYPGPAGTPEAGPYR